MSASLGARVKDDARSQQTRAYARLTSIQLFKSTPESTTASRPNPDTSEQTSYPAVLAVARSHPAALTSAAVNPAALMSAQLHPAALKAASSNPGVLRDRRSKPAAFKHGSFHAMHRAWSTALIAGTLFMFNKSGVSAAADAMSRREEEAPPALAAWIMRMQRWRVKSSDEARYKPFAACDIMLCYIAT